MRPDRFLAKGRTGGSIVQHFAADHPDLVRRLVIHSSAYKLNDAAKKMQLRVAELARQRNWGAAYAEIFGFMLPRSGSMKYAARPFVWLGSRFSGMFGVPDDPADLVVTVEAEDSHDFKDRLSEISAPTLYNIFKRYFPQVTYHRSLITHPQSPSSILQKCAQNKKCST